MIKIRDLSLTLRDFSLRDINLTIDGGEYFVILGPTGAGKTVLLESIAGLHTIKHGEIWVDGVEITHLPPEARRLGYVPQDYVLFPFLNVIGNITFGLDHTAPARSAREKQAKELANLLGISPLLDRDVRSLSGGEKQRVALARALAISPRLLLLDEPFNSLDLQTAKYLRLELRRIHLTLGITIVHVTHNQVEAEEMADRLAIIKAGRLEQVGRPHDVFFYPENEAVSDFIGALNILDCDSCRPLGSGIVEVTCDGMHVLLPHDGAAVRKIALLPRDIYVSERQPPGPQVNRFKGTVTGIKSLGAAVRLEVMVGSRTLLAEMPHDIFSEMDLKVGQEVFLILKLRRMRVLESDGEVGP
ncbi:MAG: ABC transporter ATP-binding protein [Chloroflexi bacterium]|nr:ABC transporter ATP-binding protein [Chloroflexota bacterium]